jgi:hypothetical protein
MTAGRVQQLCISNSPDSSFPPPLWGRAREGGSRDGSACGYPPSPTLPHKGGESKASEAKLSTLAFLLPHGLLRGACHRARIRATRWLAMTMKHNSAISPRISREFCLKLLPSSIRGRSATPRGEQGMPGARRARSLACKSRKHASKSPRSRRIARHSPRNGFNGFLRALPGDRA